METKNKIEKIREEGQYTKLKKDLESRNALDKEQKDIILTWMEAGYEAGLRDASFIIGRNLSKAIDKELKKGDLNSQIK